MQALSILAAEAGGPAEHSPTLFYVVGVALALWAVVLSAVGLTRPAFPTSAGAARGLMAVTALLVAGAMAASVLAG